MPEQIDRRTALLALGGIAAATVTEPWIRNMIKRGQYDAYAGLPRVPEHLQAYRTIDQTTDQPDIWKNGATIVTSVWNKGKRDTNMGVFLGSGGLVQTDTGYGIVTVEHALVPLYSETRAEVIIPALDTVAEIDREGFEPIGPGNDPVVLYRFNPRSNRYIGAKVEEEAITPLEMERTKPEIGDRMYILDLQHGEIDSWNVSGYTAINLEPGLIVSKFGDQGCKGQSGSILLGSTPDGKASNKVFGALSALNTIDLTTRCFPQLVFSTFE